MTGNIAVVGDALIDELREPHRSTDAVGGAALNVAVGLSRLGIAPTLVAMLGDDPDGSSIRRYLEEHGVRLAATPSPLGTSRAVSVRVAGEPSYEFNEAAHNRRIDFSSEVRAALGGADLVGVSCFPLDDDEQVEGLERCLAGSAALLAIDPNPRAGMMRDTRRFVSNMERLASQASLVKIGDDDAELLYGRGLAWAMDRMLELGARVVLGTAGAEGAIVMTHDGVRVEHPIIELAGPVIDTMGAGDATFAVVLAEMSRHRPRGEGDWTAVLRRAMGIAAATVRENGALLREPRS